jgi:hypothetical protein
MSNQSKKNTKSAGTNKAGQAEQKFCKVCYDAGKSSTAYSSHYVRDNIGGKVICPTILSQHCNYCKQIGHTPSYCPALEGKYKKNKAPLQKRAARLCESPPPGPMPIKPMPTPLQIRAARMCESPPPPEPMPMPTPLQKRAARLCESPPPAENYFKPIMARRWETIIKPKAQQAAEQEAAQAQPEQAQAEQVQQEEAQEQPKAASGYIPTDYSNCSWADM